MDSTFGDWRWALVPLGLTAAVVGAALAFAFSEAAATGARFQRHG